MLALYYSAGGFCWKKLVSNCFYHTGENLQVPMLSPPVEVIATWGSFFLAKNTVEEEKVNVLLS